MKNMSIKPTREDYIIILNVLGIKYKEWYPAFLLKYLAFKKLRAIGFLDNKKKIKTKSP